MNVGDPVLFVHSLNTDNSNYYKNGIISGIAVTENGMEYYIDCADVMGQRALLIRNEEFVFFDGIPDKVMNELVNL